VLHRIAQHSQAVFSAVWVNYAVFVKVVFSGGSVSGSFKGFLWTNRK